MTDEPTHNSTTPPPPPPPPPAFSYTPQTFTQYSLTDSQQSQERFGRGVLYALGTGIGVGTIWYFVVTLIKIQSVYLAIGVGFAIGAMYIKGSLRPSPQGGITSGTIAVATILVAQYFIDRHFLIQAVQREFTGVHVPVWLGLTPAYRLMKLSLENNWFRLLAWAAAIAAAYMQGANGQIRGRKLR